MGLFSRHLRLLFLVTALVVAAFSTGLDFLFFFLCLAVSTLAAVSALELVLEFI